MALISHADWLDRFGDEAEDGSAFDPGSLRFELVPAAAPASVGDTRPRRDPTARRPLLGYRAGPPYRERRAEPRAAR